MQVLLEVWYMMMYLVLGVVGWDWGSDVVLDGNWMHLLEVRRDDG